MALLTQDLMTQRKDVAETEGGRRPTGVSASAEHDGTSQPDPEVLAKPKRRTFSAEYRLRILKEADGCKAGELGALLRREGLYSSHLVTWRRQREARALAGMKARKRGPQGRVEDPRLKQQEREIARLQRKLKQAETIIEIQKNLRAPRRVLLDQKLPSAYLLRRPRGVAVSLLVPPSPKKNMVWGWLRT